MEIEESIKTNPKCYKCHLRLMGALNIEYNTSSSTFILWNKYEIFVYENLTFGSACKVFVPEFQIYHLISSNNFIVCLDYTGNVHTISMKFKHTTQKYVKANFLPREQLVLICVPYTADKVLCLKLEQNIYYLCIHNFNSEFELVKKVKIVSNVEFSQYDMKLQKLCILKCHKIPLHQLENVIQLFNINKNIWKDYSLIIISFDRRNLFGCLYSSKMTEDEISLIKLYTTPSEICDIKITEENQLLQIIIGLIAGTLIRLTVGSSCKATDIVHLNAAISKCAAFNDTIIYTDGVSMWKSENTFVADIKFQQLVVWQVKDFVRFGDQILCTTFTNLIYLLMLDDETSYLKTSVNEYCEAGNVLDNSGYLYKILEEVDRNDKLAKKIKEESNYITALSLSNRPDILDKVIGYSVVVYEKYEEVLKEGVELTLTENINEYFVNNLFYFLIKINVSFEKQKISDVLLQVLKDLMIHVTMLSGQKVIKTTSIKVLDELKNFNILVPLSSRIINSTVDVNIKIVKRIPGAFAEEQVLWTIMHQKQISLNSEHFIKSKVITKNIIFLKEPEYSVEDTIHHVSYNHNKHLFKFTDISNLRQLDEWSFYMKLPKNYEEAFKNETFYKQKFSYNKATQLLQENTSEEFIKGLNNISFETGNNKVKIEVINDGFLSTSLKITSKDMKIGLDLRNFYSDLTYNNFKEYRPGKEFVRYTLYTTVENFQKAVKQSITEGFKNERLKVLLEQFQRDVFCALPL
ncbi:unnamed protein product [Parnassius mnemosyne]|uniref:Uncharacterized protein n=1 Tax=Parnassius mnemosyne TaxID=213953 RepID=A0AAV1LB68_9NEOP